MVESMLELLQDLFKNAGYDVIIRNHCMMGVYNRSYYIGTVIIYHDKVRMAPQSFGSRDSDFFYADPDFDVQLLRALAS